MKLCANCRLEFEPASNRAKFCGECRSFTLRERNALSAKAYRDRKGEANEWFRITCPYAGAHLLGGVLVRPAFPWWPDGIQVPVGKWAGPGPGVSLEAYVGRGVLRPAVGGKDCGPSYLASQGQRT